MIQGKLFIPTCIHLQAVADAAAEWLPEMTELVHLDISVEAHSDYPFSPPFNHGKIRYDSHINLFAHLR